jgi:hypothetical protein
LGATGSMRDDGEPREAPGGSNVANSVIALALEGEGPVVSTAVAWGRKGSVDGGRHMRSRRRRGTMSNRMAGAVWYHQWYLQL